MNTRCDVEVIFEPLENLLRKVFHEGKLSEEEKKTANDLIDKYWQMECPAENPCHANTYSFANPIDWLEYCGYISLSDYLNQLRAGKRVRYFDVFRAEWARQKGHYNG